ncbi:hypothetical protein [Candidatus Nitrotoga sp. 1052]|uniref:hypothetical protein n=1 Tax=Candidatus Nitrotoga sp. 1052 TaxID=2886964 RepID=UPI001EF5C331|nr:hypothetical protein [Candidatus Nitrotoga sp. 1052]CAH1072469.1 hypothetical protein NTG1052_180056 [Candidatus Nitrotoga sp. 1052]
MTERDKKPTRNRNAKFLIFTGEADESRSADDDTTNSERTAFRIELDALLFAAGRG